MPQPNKTAARGWAELTKAEQRQIAMHLQSLEKTVDVKVPVKPKGQFSLKGYVRCELSSADKDAFRLWEELQSTGSIWEQVVGLVDSGYLFKSGSGKDGFQASLSASDTGSSWDGYVLTAFASDAGRAIALVIYKHAVLMQSDWSAWMAEPEGDFFR